MTMCAIAHPSASLGPRLNRGEMEHDHRRRAAVAGHQGDEAGARALLADADPRARATALGALARMGALGTADIERGLGDADARVRRQACEEAVAFTDI